MRTRSGGKMEREGGMVDIIQESVMESGLNTTRVEASCLMKIISMGSKMAPRMSGMKMVLSTQGANMYMENE